MENICRAQVELGNQRLRQLVAPVDDLTESFIHNRFGGFVEMVECEGIPLSKLTAILQSCALPTEDIGEYFLWGFLESRFVDEKHFGSAVFERYISLTMLYCAHFSWRDNCDNHELILY